MKSRILIVVLFIVAFMAGWSVGRVSRQPLMHRSSSGPSWLSEELHLSPQQRQSMLEIWDQVNRNGQEDGNARRDLQKQRQEAIAQLIATDKQVDYQKLLDDYNNKMAELSSQRRKRFEEAIAKTKAVLDADQQKRYEAILAQRESARSRGTRGRHGARDEHARPMGRQEGVMPAQRGHDGQAPLNPRDNSEPTADE